MLAQGHETVFEPFVTEGAVGAPYPDTGLHVAVLTAVDFFVSLEYGLLVFGMDVVDKHLCVEQRLLSGRIAVAFEQSLVVVKEIVFDVVFPRVNFAAFQRERSEPVFAVEFFLDDDPFDIERHYFGEELVKRDFVFCPAQVVILADSGEKTVEVVVDEQRNRQRALEMHLLRPKEIHEYGVGGIFVAVNDFHVALAKMFQRFRPAEKAVCLHLGEKFV